MTTKRWRLRCAAIIGVLTAIVSAAGAPVAAGASQRRVNATAASQAAFLERVDEYVQLHKKLEATLPKLPDKATPQQIDQNQRAMGELVVKARANAKPGDLFTPDMQRIIRRLCAEVFKGKAGQESRKYIHDEPHPVTPEVNKRYPDTVPLATMPTRVLAELPKLPDGLEYRFVYSHLILMDVHSHVILDYVLNAMPSSPAPGGRR